MERVKEGGKVPAEGSDTHLGARCREFESPHSDQIPQRICPLRYFFIEQMSFKDTCPAELFRHRERYLLGCWASALAEVR